MSAPEVRLDASQVEAFLRLAGPNARKGVKRALRRLGTKVQRSMVEEFRRRGVGRQLFGRKAAGARKIIRRSRLRETVLDIIQPIKISGLAALQQEGGHTRGHTIVPKTRPLLAFRVQGRPIFTTKVNHPGSNMPAIPFADAAASKHRSDFSAEIAKEIERALSA